MHIVMHVKYNGLLALHSGQSRLDFSHYFGLSASWMCLNLAANDWTAIFERGSMILSFLLVGRTLGIMELGSGSIFVVVVDWGFICTNY